MEEVKRCPTCHQPITKGPAKVCRACKRPIGRYDKWRFVADGLEHRNCAAPQSYKNEAKPVDQADLIEGL